MAWSIINVITGPCKCGKGLLRSVHKTDGEGNYETDWSLTCPDCSSKYYLEKEVLVGNPDKSLSAVKYREKENAPAEGGKAISAVKYMETPAESASVI